MRGERLYTAMPELTGIGYRETGFRVSPAEDIAMAKSVVHRTNKPEWAKELAGLLRQRKGEFKMWKQHALERIMEFAAKMPDYDEDSYRPLVASGAAAGGFLVPHLVTAHATIHGLTGKETSHFAPEDEHVRQALHKTAEEQGWKVVEHDQGPMEKFIDREVQGNFGKTKIPEKGPPPIRATTKAMRQKPAFASPSTKTVHIGEAVKPYYKPGLLAHEIGHAKDSFIKSKLGQGLYAAGPIGALLGSAGAIVSSDEKVAKGSVAGGTIVTAPMLAAEIKASLTGIKELRKSGIKGLRALTPASGLATYATVAAAPSIAYGIKKSLGGYRKRAPFDPKTGLPLAKK